MARKKFEDKIVGWFRVEWKDKKGNSYPEQFDGIRDGMSFEDVRARLAEIEEKYGKEFEKFKIERETKHGYYEDTWDEYHVWGWREETDAELKARLDTAAKMEAEKAAREKAEFERLKKKFENG